MSPYLAERICFVGQQAVFEEASTLLDELVGVSVTAKQIERLCHYFGQLVDPEPEAPGRAGSGPVYAMARVAR